MAGGSAAGARRSRWTQLNRTKPGSIECPSPPPLRPPAQVFPAPAPGASLAEAAIAKLMFPAAENGGDGRLELPPARRIQSEEKELDGKVCVWRAGRWAAVLRHASALRRSMPCAAWHVLFPCGPPRAAARCIAFHLSRSTPTSLGPAAPPRAAATRQAACWAWDALRAAAAAAGRRAEAAQGASGLERMAAADSRQMQRGLTPFGAACPLAPPVRAGQTKAPGCGGGAAGAGLRPGLLGAQRPVGPQEGGSVPADSGLLPPAVRAPGPALLRAALAATRRRPQLASASAAHPLSMGPHSPRCACGFTSMRGEV